MSRTFSLLILAVAIILAIITRFYKLGVAPAGLYLDEAGQGYSAYSILLTGKDEFGKAYPFIFRSFTDFKTPVYIYLIVPLIPIFGLTSFTVRFPSFFFSILTIPLFYLLINKINTRDKLEIGNGNRRKTLWRLEILATLLLAISPWHILFGRTNFECNVALFFLLGGLYFFYKGLEKPKDLIISAILLAIALPAYHAQRIVTPAMALLLFIRHRKILLSTPHKKYLIIAAVIGLVISIPTLTIAATPGFLARATGLNIFSVKEKSPSGTIHKDTGALEPLVNNRVFLTSKEFASLYVSYLSPRYMFQLGDYGPRSSFPELGTFFVWQFPFYLYGLYKFIKAKDIPELKFFTISLLLISPLPAAVTRDPYSSIRALQLVIPQLIIISYGIVMVYDHLKRSIQRIGFALIISLLICYSLAKLYSSVIILNEYYRAPEWNYGWQELSTVIKTLDPEKTVVIDSARGEPYIELLFFLKYDPQKYREDNFEVSVNDYYTLMSRRDHWKLGNIIIRPINWTPDTKLDQYLVGDKLAISDEQVRVHGLEIIEDIFYPDGTLAFRIVKTNPK